MNMARVDGKDQTARTALLAWLAGALVGLAVVLQLYGQRHTDFEQVTLAQGTSAVYAKVDAVPIHCADDRDMDQCIAGAR